MKTHFYATFQKIDELNYWFKEQMEPVSSKGGSDQGNQNQIRIEMVYEYSKSKTVSNNHSIIPPQDPPSPVNRREPTPPQNQPPTTQVNKGNVTGELLSLQMKSGKNKSLTLSLTKSSSTHG